MRKTTASLPFVLACALAACGQNEAQPDEVNTPESAAAMKETEQQRQAEVLHEEQQKEAQEFDAAEQ